MAFCIAALETQQHREGGCPQANTQRVLLAEPKSPLTETKREGIPERCTRRGGLEYSSPSRS
jgi:hypothetical protein